MKNIRVFVAFRQASNVISKRDLYIPALGVVVVVVGIGVGPKENSETILECITDFKVLCFLKVWQASRTVRYLSGHVNMVIMPQTVCVLKDIMLEDLGLF